MIKGQKVFTSFVKLENFSSSCGDAAVFDVANICRLSYGGGTFGSDERTKRENGIEDDMRLLQHCFNSGHMSVFEFVDATVLIECPIFVARQLMRYRHASYLEQSCRRVEPSPLSNVFQAEDGCDERISEHEKVARELYNELIALGIRREIARAVLPIGSTTKFFMKANLREWYHIFDERLTPSAQIETRVTVLKIKDEIAKVYPFFITLWDKKNHGTEILSDRSNSGCFGSSKNN